MPLAARSRLRADWRACAAASYVCDLLSRVSTSGGHEVALYRLAGVMLDELLRGEASLALLFWYEVFTSLIPSLYCLLDWYFCPVFVSPFASIPSLASISSSASSQKPQKVTNTNSATMNLIDPPFVEKKYVKVSTSKWY